MKITQQLIISVIVIVTVTPIIFSAKGENMDHGKKKNAAVPDFKKLSYPEGDETVDQFIKKRRSIVSNMESQLRSENLSNEQKTYLIYVIGSFRDYRSAVGLVKIIDFKTAKVDPKDRKGRWSQYPAVDALKKIGIPAANEIIAKAQRNQTDLRLKKMATVVDAIYGKKIAMILLQDAIDIAPDSKAKSNLRLLLKLISKFQQ